MLWNPTLASQYLDHFDGGTFGNSKETKLVDGKVAVDTFRVHSIAQFNRFSCPSVKSSDALSDKREKASEERSTGIWHRASYSNHSYLPNVNRAFVGDMMIARAVKDIAAGEEIFMNYMPWLHVLDDRRKELKERYGFECHCRLCQTQAALATYKDTIRSIQECTRVALRHFLDGVRDAVLRDEGYDVATGKKVEIGRGNAVPKMKTLIAARYAARALQVLGNANAADAVNALAKRFFVDLCGLEEAFEAAFG